MIIHISISMHPISRHRASPRLIAAREDIRERRAMRLVAPSKVVVDDGALDGVHRLRGAACRAPRLRLRLRCIRLRNNLLNLTLRHADPPEPLYSTCTVPVLYMYRDFRELLAGQARTGLAKWHKKCTGALV